MWDFFEHTFTCGIAYFTRKKKESKESEYFIPHWKCYHFHVENTYYFRGYDSSSQIVIPNSMVGELILGVLGQSFVVDLLYCMHKTQELIGV